LAGELNRDFRERLRIPDILDLDSSEGEVRVFSRARQFWRIVRELDLDAIRRHAETPVRLTVIAETTGEAERMADCLGGDAWAGNESLRVMELAEASKRESGLPGPAGEVETDVAVLVAREPGLSPAMAATRNALAGKLPVVTVVVGAAYGTAGAAAYGESARVAVPALGDDSLGVIAPALLSAVQPDTRLALARRFPALRPAVFDALITETARVNAGYAFTTGLAEVVPALTVPVNIGDILILTKNQLIMSYRLALAAGKDGHPRQVVGLVPVIGIVPKVAIAYGGTWAIGRAVALWAAEGRRVTRRSFRELFRRGLADGQKVARSLAASSRAKAS
jgi:hypothetical protein